MMKNLLLILFLGCVSLSASFGQINQNSNPAAVGIDALTLGIGQTGDVDAVVENNGSDPMPAGTFRVYIGIDPAKMEFVDPASYISSTYPDWTVVSVSASQLVLVNGNGEMSSSENIAFKIKVLAKATATAGNSSLSLRVGIAPGKGALAGNADNSTADDNAPGIIVLPVTLVSFSASKENKVAMLNWETTEETNSERFEVQRSLNGKEWAILGSVASAGESKVLKQYVYTDVAPKSGENLYRLKMVDRDNTFAYSRIQAVSFGDQAKAFAYPNPASEWITIENAQLVSQVVFHNANGLKVLISNKVPASGIDVSRLQKGIYTLSVTMTDGSVNTSTVAIVR